MFLWAWHQWWTIKNCINMRHFISQQEFTFLAHALCTARCSRQAERRINPCVKALANPALVAF